MHIRLVFINNHLRRRSLISKQMRQPNEEKFVSFGRAYVQTFDDAEDRMATYSVYTIFLMMRVLDSRVYVKPVEKA